MDCAELLATFTEYRDGRLDGRDRRRIDRHLERCASCRRYRRVVEEGVDTLRSLPPQPVPEHFRPRLQHRIFHVDDDLALGRRSSTSGMSGTAAVAMAFLLGLAAWGPAIQPQEAEVTLAPIVVREPPPVPGPELRLPPSAFFGRSAPTGTGATRDNSLVPVRSFLLETSYDPLHIHRPTATRAAWLGLD